MNTTPPIIPPRSIAARAADGGIIMGGLIMVLVLSFGFATIFPAVSLLLWGGTFAVPFVLYFLLRRSYAQTGYTESIIELWAEGIAIFFLGSLIPALVVYLLLKFVQPDFIANQMEFVVGELERIESTPQTEQLIRNLQTIREGGLLPTAAQVAAQLIAMNMLIGMVLSLIEANILVFRHRSRERRQSIKPRP